MISRLRHFSVVRDPRAQDAGADAAEDSSKARSVTLSLPRARYTPRQMRVDKIATPDESRRRQKPPTRDRASSSPSQQPYYASRKMLPQLRGAADAPSAKSLIEEDEWSKIKFHAALERREAAEFNRRSRAARHFAALMKVTRIYLILLFSLFPPPLSLLSLLSLFLSCRCVTV